ncbi:MAG: response regulator [Polaromonas sp.]|nr:response regulator [Polaromonas sp.]
MVLHHILQEEGYLATIAVDGKSALEMASRLRPALIISDVNMPGMSGYELCRRVKSHPELSLTPIILVTSMSESEDVLLGLKSGADSFVIKPYSRTHLMARIAHALKPRPQTSPEENAPPIAIEFNGHMHAVSATRRQILDLLMSTYEATSQRNQELHESREQLRIKTQETQAANRFLDSLIENIPDMIFVKDAADLRFVSLNTAGEELLGLPRAALLGKNDYDFFPKHEGDYFTAKDRETLAGGKLIEIEEEPIHTVHKGIRLLHTKKVPITNSEGVATHLLGISEDVTDQKELEKRLAELHDALAARAEELEAVNKSLESFTWAATHDLRGPLSVIGGYLGLLQKSYGSTMDDKGQRYLSMIGASVKGMAKLIDDLLDFARAGVREVSKTQVDMNHLLNGVVTSWMQADPAHAGVTLRIDELPPTHADPALIEQVWVNLFSNAVKYSRRQDKPLIEIRGEETGDGVTYSIRDNGAGFDMAQYDKLFAMFQRLHVDVDFEGIGVGLPLVQRIISRHGGRIWAEGAVGAGAVFYFSLPSQDTARQAVSAARHA